MPKALFAGVTGQYGSYRFELLLSKGNGGGVREGVTEMIMPQHYELPDLTGEIFKTIGRLYLRRLEGKIFKKPMPH